MAKLNLQYDIANLTPADASPVEANYNRIEQHVNQEIIERDGSVAMRSELLLSNDPLTPLGAATKQYVDQVLPIGVIMPFGGAGTPPGGKWLACDGTELEIASFQLLFDVIGTRYVTGTVAAGRFNVPDMRLRVPLGAQPGTTEIGSRGGSADAIPNHTHPIPHSHAGTTDNQNSFHYHDGVDHLHGVSITSSTESVFHQHMMQGNFYHVTSNPGFYLDTSPGNPFLPADTLDLGNYGTGNQLQLHTHAVNGATGAADRSLNTSQERGWHQHPYTTPGYSGDSGTPAGGVAATNANLPPYVAMTWIIRAA